jgi:hypothetical protein
MNAQQKTYVDPPATVEADRFWAATANGQLLIGHCNTCNEAHYYPRSLCPNCFSDDVDWVASSGTGTIYSYSVMRRAPVPYTIAYVTLAEGVTVLTNLVDCDFDGLAIGQQVTLTFGDTEGGMALPLFKPTGG